MARRSSSGLPDRAVTEARERVRAGVIASELWWPQGRVVVNLAPGNVPKLGPASRPRDGGRDPGRQPTSCRASARGRVLVLGELAFDGRLRPVHGALIAAETARRVGLDGARLPACLRRGGGAGHRPARARRPTPDRGRGVAARRARAAGGRRPRAARRCPLRPISPTCAGSRSHAGRSSSPPSAATTC